MKYIKGFSIAEVIISVGILSVIVYAVGTFQKDIFSLNFSAQHSLSAQIDARKVLKQMVAELREASPSSLGGYPISLASTSALTFYSDINNDGFKERIRYFMVGNTLRRGEISPNGNPLVYNNANEKITLIVSDVVTSTSTPLFSYYPGTFAGTSSPLIHPVVISDIRMVGIYITIQKDPLRNPKPIIVQTAVTIRNIKDNL